MAALPKIIWFLWLQGLSEAPEIVRRCHESWRRRNPDWELRTLDRPDLGRLLDLDALLGPQLATISPQALSDIARVGLLAAHGGVWADASTFCQRPLDDWLPGELGGGFFAFTRPGRDRLISSWFLAGARGHPLTAAWEAQVRRYWEGPPFQDRPRLAHALEKLLGGSVAATGLWLTPLVRQGLKVRPYYWLHYLFAETLRRDRGAAEAWAQAGKRPADGPHRLQHEGVARPASLALRAEIEAGSQPLYKLDLRGAAAALGAGGALDLLMSRGETGNAEVAPPG
jgi:hypothetical protein